MRIEKQSISPIDFRGLQIFDYTGSKDYSSSLAEIVVPVGGKHPKAWSRKCDKFYYVISGQIRFWLDDETFELNSRDICIVKKEQKFSYENVSNSESKLILVHTPAFDMSAEVFEE